MRQYRQLVDEVVGIVYPFGAGGGKAGEDDSWTLTFTLVAWKPAGGPVGDRRLHVSQPGLTNEQLRERMAGIDSEDILRLRVRFAEPPDDGELVYAELVERVGPVADDAELNERLAELRRPVVVPHPVLGPLTLDRKHDWYECELDWPGGPVKFTLERGEDEDDPALFATAEQVWHDRYDWHDQVRECALRDLLELKNDCWLEDDETELTEAQFLERMKLESVSMDPDGRLTFWHDDGGLFWGHVIMVEGTLGDGPTDATIAG